MKNIFRIAVVCSSTAFLIVANLSLGAENPSAKYPKIIKQPLSVISEEGTFVELAVLVDNKGNPVTYQWQWNNGANPTNFTDISGATNRTYWFDHVQFTNVASYRVAATADATILTSDMAHLSVFRRYHTNSTAGTLQTPVLAFSTSGSVSCDGTSFTHAYSPTNDLGTTGYFYGKTSSPQYSPFQNSSYPKLNADTMSTENTPANTGIKIRKNFGDGAVITCNSTHSPDTGAATPTIDLSDINNYRITIYYGSIPPSSGKITYNWHYHDP